MHGKFKELVLKPEHKPMVYCVRIDTTYHYYLLIGNRVRTIGVEYALALIEQGSVLSQEPPMQMETVGEYSS